MVEENGKWNPTCNRFVAFLDIMGFKDLVTRNTHNDVYNMLNPLVYCVDGLDKMALKGTLEIDSKCKNGTNISLRTRIALFSDSVFVFSIDTTEESFLHLLAVTNIIFKYAFSSPIPIPIKAAIAYGNLTADFNRGFYFGRPIIDAFELQKELLYYGVILHHTVEKYLIDNNFMHKIENGILFRYPSPMKSGTITHYSVDWEYFVQNDKTSQGIITNLYNCVSGKPRKYVDNTVDYIRWLKKKKEELAQQEKKPTL
jgi:hypothetical protein